jgi:peptidase S41-like protein/tricorn protease-like protein
MKRRGILIACLALAGGCATDLVGPPPSTDYASLFDTVWREFDLHYSFFELKGVDWNAVGARHRPAAVAATSDRAFAAELAAMFAELHDPHVSLTPFGPGSTMRYIAPSDTARTNYSAPQTLARYVPSAKTTSNGTGHVQYGMTASGVGYMRIASFIGQGWSSEIDEALGALGSASSMIVDIRGNGGGNRNVALEMAGRFADRSRVFGYLRYRNGSGHGDFTDYVTETVDPQGSRRFSGPVYVLTNRGDYSSAEDFVLAMRVLPQVTIVGDTTGGASGGPIVRELPNGWTYELSQWIEYTPDKKTFEGAGLAPDIAVKPTVTTFAAGRDAVIDQVLTLAGASR